MLQGWPTNLIPKLFAPSKKTHSSSYTRRMTIQQIEHFYADIFFLFAHHLPNHQSWWWARTLNPNCQSVVVISGVWIVNRSLWQMLAGHGTGSTVPPISFLPLGTVRSVRLSHVPVSALWGRIRTLASAAQCKQVLNPPNPLFVLGQRQSGDNYSWRLWTGNDYWCPLCIGVNNHGNLTLASSVFHGAKNYFILTLLLLFFFKTPEPLEFEFLVLGPMNHVLLRLDHCP
jgi:hypothetical protein